MLAHPGLDAVFLATPTTLHADQIIGGARGGQARVLGKAARAQSGRLPARRGGRGEASAAEGDDRLRAPVRSQLSRRARQDQGRRDRPAVPRALADRRPERRQRLLRALRGRLRRHPARHERPRHRHRALAARARAARSACSPPARSPCTRACARSATSTTPSRRSSSTAAQIATIYASRTMAHGHETLTEIVGTAGRLTVGQNPRINRVEISDAHGVRNECTPTFYERFAEAFLQRSADLRRRRARGPAAAAHARRRHRGDAHRHRGHRVAAHAEDGRALEPATRPFPERGPRRRLVRERFGSAR